jgi:hypothetical protein
MQRVLALPLKELSPAEARDYAPLREGIAMWRTGEQTTVSLPWPVLRPPTKAEAFAADPLGAPLAGVERYSPFYSSVLDGQAAWLSQETVDRLESPTGTWTRGDIAALLARGER